MVIFTTKSAEILKGELLPDPISDFVVVAYFPSKHIMTYTFMRHY